MWTAKIQGKNYVNGAIEVHVDFTDGVKVVTESCIPQDKAGFEFWVKSRLDTFNGGEVIDTEYAVDEPVVIPTPPTPPEPTAEELASREWHKNFLILQDLKKLVDVGVFTGNETQIVNLRNKVRNDFLPVYLGLI
jgi:hypothetical protein